jgi:TRAP-type C4-dicarboxylate transport system substrate-binding protein
MKKLAITLLGASLIAGLLGACTKSPQTGAATNEKYTLRAAHYFKEDHPWNQGLVYFANKVKEESKGRVQIDIFNGGVLGSEAQYMQFLKDGSLDFAVSDPSGGSNFAKELDFFALPFMFRDYAQWKNSLDGEPGQKYAKLIEDKTGIKILPPAPDFQPAQGERLESCRHRSDSHRLHGNLPGDEIGRSGWNGKRVRLGLEHEIL